MANVFNTSRTIQIRYDLKGSKHGRQTRKTPDDVIAPGVALKDLDFDKDGMKIEIDPDTKAAMLKQIEMDVKLFQLLEINDYSLLLGVHKLEGGETEGRLLLQKYD